jgi:hypothetical protein
MFAQQRAAAMDERVAIGQQRDKRRGCHAPND